MDHDDLLRIIVAVESIADSLQKLANPPIEVPPMTIPVDRQEAVYQIGQAMNHLSVATKHLTP